MEKPKDASLIAVIENLIDQDRVMSFSDSVFAFAATLLVIKIDLPTIVESRINTDFLPTLMTLWPQYFANIITFAIIGFYWLNHHAIFALVGKINRVIVWLNILFLIFLSFLPFPVDLYGDHNTVPVVVAFYCASLALAGFLLAGIWMYAVRAKLIQERVNKKTIRFYTLQYLVAPTIFLLSVPLAFIHPLVAQCSWILILLILGLLSAKFGQKKPSELEKLAAD